MKRKWIKRIGWILLIPVLLFLLLVVLVYLPPVQNYLKKELTAYASKASGMQISIDYLRLRFPLNLEINNAIAIQQSDTLVALESLNMRMKVLPLFSGELEFDGISVDNASVNSAGLISGMRLQGRIGHLYVVSRGVNLSQETAVVNQVDLKNTSLQLHLNDSVAEKNDTVQEALRWRLVLESLNFGNISFGLVIPADSTQLYTRIGDLSVENVDVDLLQQLYALESFRLSNTSLTYDVVNVPPVDGFDTSHISLRNMRMGLDSLKSRGRELHAVISECSMDERSGLSITSLTGNIFMDTLSLRVPRLTLTTPHSDLNFRARMEWDPGRNLMEGPLTARLNANIGKQDVLLFAGGLSESFKKAYPFRPLTIQVVAEGNLDNLQLPQLSADLPGAFTLSGNGILANMSDSVNRSGTIDLSMVGQNLGFLSALVPGNRVRIPRNISMTANATMRGPQVDAQALLRESVGKISLNGRLNTHNQVYTATVAIDSLQVNHFLPQDSIYSVSATATAQGRGFDFTSARSNASVTASVDRLEYSRYMISDIDLSAELRNALVSGRLTSNNALLVMDAEGEYNLSSRYTNARLNAHVARLEIDDLGLIPERFGEPISFTLTAAALNDTVRGELVTGDLRIRLRAVEAMEPLLSQSRVFMDVLTRQINARVLDHAELRRALPSASLVVNSGNNNPLSRYLSSKNIRYKRVDVAFVGTPRIGINGQAMINTLRVDTLQLDTVFFAIQQDTTRMRLLGDVINGPGNPQFDFRASITGEVRTDDAELTVEYQNENGDTGLLLGVNARPQDNGFLFSLIPENPVVAFRPFSFNGHNTVFLRNDRRLVADVQMLNTEGMGLIVRSLPDTSYLQNLDIEIRRIPLADISRMLPYYPGFGGLFSLEANYRQSQDRMQVSAEATIGDFEYEDRRVGNLGVGATWFPGPGNMNYLNAYFANEGTEILTANGTYQSSDGGNLDVNAVLDHFPMSLADAFIPDGLVSLTGDLDGDLYIAGAPSTPQVNGELRLDSVTAVSAQYGVSLRFDNRPLNITNSRLIFDQFGIYASTDNPFTINGYIDFQDLANARADLALLAQNYRLLDAPRTDSSIVYGRVVVDLNSTIRGPLSNLAMRGNLNVLGSTNATYVLTDSPLTVQDRLGDLVEFVSFSDTINQQTDDVQTGTLSGFDVMMTIGIDPAVQLRADLSPDQSNYVALQGGGDLSFQYTIQGDMLLSGRYTLQGGTIKYSLPVIPLKEFAITEDSYVEFSGDPMNPNLNIIAVERMRVSVANTGDDGSRMVSFDVSIEVKNTLENMDVVFNLDAPEDMEVQNELAAMSVEERSKQAIAMMATGTYLARGGRSEGLDMGAAFDNLLQSQLTGLAGSALKNMNISLGMENYDDPSGNQRTDYNFRYSQRFFNDRVQVVIGGRVSTGSDTEQTQSFIDNVSLEYRLDDSGSRYVRLYHDRNYESLFEGEVIETGAGLVLRKRVNRLGELFIFRRKKNKTENQ